jgi:hypothetical protein
MHYSIPKYKCVCLTKTKPLGDGQPQGEYVCTDQNQHAPSPSKAGSQSVAAYLRVQFLDFEMHYINGPPPEKKRWLNYKQPNFVVFFVASHIIGIANAIQTVPVTIQNPKQIAACLELKRTRNG